MKDSEYDDIIGQYVLIDGTILKSYNEFAITIADKYATMVTNDRYSRKRMFNSFYNRIRESDFNTEYQYIKESLYPSGHIDAGYAHQIDLGLERNPDKDMIKHGKIL